MARPETIRDILALDKPTWFAWITGYQAGYLHGLEEGRAQADDEANQLTRRAAAAAHNHANMPPHR